MDVLIDASHKLTLDIEPPTVLPTISPAVMNDSSNAKVKDPPPITNITSNDAKVEGAYSLVVPPADDHPAIRPVVVSIDHREKFTTKQKFATRNNLFE